MSLMFKCHLLPNRLRDVCLPSLLVVPLFTTSYSPSLPALITSSPAVQTSLGAGFPEAEQKSSNCWLFLAWDSSSGQRENYI